MDLNPGSRNCWDSGFATGSNIPGGVLMKKTVKRFGNGGHIILPRAWIGKEIIINEN
jgi:putative transposon-encoded protein